MESTEGWRLYEPRVSQENRSWGTEPGRKNFTQILIPEKKHEQIPGFIFSFFDPQTGKYVERRSAPVALTVLGEFKAPANAAGDAKDFAGGVDATAPVEELGDIIDRPLTVSPWIATAAVPIPVSPVLLHGVPALLLSLLLGAGVMRRFQAAAEARRPLPGAPREPAAVKSDLRRSGLDHRAFYGFVNEYLSAAAFHQPAGAPLEVPAEIKEARDRWLYGPEDATASQPVSKELRQRTLELLGKL
jgi:hypothetical protein